MTVMEGHFNSTSSWHASIPLNSAKAIITSVVNPNTETQGLSKETQSMGSANYGYVYGRSYHDEDPYESETDAQDVPELIQDNDSTRREQLMRLIVDLVTVSLDQKKRCSCCSASSIKKILLNLLNVTKFGLVHFAATVLTIDAHLANLPDCCIKYIILGSFINSSGIELPRWSEILFISIETLRLLSLRYERKDFPREQIASFNQDLMRLVKSQVRVIS